MSESAKIIEVGDFSLWRKRDDWLRRQSAECKHRRIEIDERGNVVACRDCKIQLSPVWALVELASRWAEYQKNIDDKRERTQAVIDEAKKNISLIAARVVERAWRSRSMVPSCPHCHRGIFPEDGFGRSAVNREIEQRQRAAKESK